LDYGTYPEQRRRIFSKGDKDLITLRKGNEGVKTNAVIQLGLVALIKNLMATNWWVEGDTDGDEMVHLSKIMIDSGYVPEVVDNAIRLVNSPIVVPSKGSGVKATNKPMRQWHKNKGRR
jgi:hypothetical protein